MHQATRFRTRYPAAVLVTMQHAQTTGEKYFTLHTPPTRIHISYRVRVCMHLLKLRVLHSGYIPQASLPMQAIQYHSQIASVFGYPAAVVLSIQSCAHIFNTRKEGTRCSTAHTHSPNMVIRIIQTATHMMLQSS